MIEPLTKPDGLRLTDEEGWRLEVTEKASGLTAVDHIRGTETARYLLTNEERSALGKWMLRHEHADLYREGLRAALEAVKQVDGPTSWAVEHIQDLIDNPQAHEADHA